MNEYNSFYIKKKSSERNYGFTLIELLVTLTIASILFGLGFVNFRNYQRKQAVLGAVRQLEGDIKLASEFAFSGSKPTSGCQTLVGYKVRIITSENAYQVNAVCINGVAVGDYSPEKKKVTLSSNLILGKTTSRDNIIYKTLGQGTDAQAAEPEPPVVITIQHRGTTIVATLSISKIGETTIIY